MSDPEKPVPGGDNPSDIKPVSITDEMRRSYLDYAMSVIVSRALPDVRDGLKPVHRRILFSMHENGYDWNKAYRKSARVVGDVIGKYHPHGDQSVYDALVRLAQDFSMRLTLVDGQGNFGSVDGDNAAAMRYTEVRLEKVAHSLLEDLDKDTVDFQPNYDNSESEPTVLPARFPNLLVNGAGGIAVGMATNIPPHNLGEVVDAVTALIDRPDMSIEDLIEILPGPDFPTGGIILGRAGIRAAYHNGRGSITMRGRVKFETARGGREAIIVHEIPYQVNKAAMVERIGELVREKRIEGIAEVRDESDRDGYRVVVEVKRDAMPDVVLNQLYRFTTLQTTFGCNVVALNGGKPELLNLRDMLTAFVAFREEVVGRRTRFLLNKARDRAHILVGLAIAVANIDEVIHLIRHAPDPATAKAGLMGRDWPAKDMAPLIALIADPRHTLNEDGTYRLSDEQARAILELRLARLTALGRDEIAEELEKLAREIEDYLDILRSRARILGIIKDELAAIRAEFATPRRTEIVDLDGEVDDEDLIQREDMVVTVTHAGWIKRVPLSTYRAQRRGGKGRSGMSTKDEDFVTRLFVANTHAPILFFSSNGIAYKTKVWRLPLAAPQARGKALVNLLPLSEGERISSILLLPEDEAQWDTLDVVFATTGGTIRRNKLSDFVQVNRNGKIAMKLEEGEGIVSVETCTEHDDVLITTAQGQCIRFPVTEVRVFKGRDSMGVRGISLGEGDTVISMTVINHVDATPDERAEYLKRRRAMRGETEGEVNGDLNGDNGSADAREAGAAGRTDTAVGPDANGSGGAGGRRANGADGAGGSDANGTESDADGEEGAGGIELGDRYTEMSSREQFILTVSENGYGKRTSSYEYRATGRGGKGIVAMAVTPRNGPLVASFPVEDGDQIMLVTDAGQLIRCPVEGIRIAGRSTQGVIVFDTAEDEKVVSVERIREEEGEENGDSSSNPC